jgi:hypothetical protein
VVLRVDGVVRCWGRNFEGQCNVPSSLGPVVSIAAGYSHSVALSASGRVVAWGFNADGQVNVPPLLAPASALVAGGHSTFVIAGPRLSDSDGDQVADPYDNCVAVANPGQADCDADGIGDACVIAAGGTDVNINGIPDSCECIADIFVDGRVDGGDLGGLLAQWGPSVVTTVADLNRDGLVNGGDLGILLSNWGPCSN